MVLTHCWEDKGVHAFSKGICLKMNVIARLEFEPAYYDFAVKRINHYITRCIKLSVLDKNAWDHIIMLKLFEIIIF